MSLEPYEDYKEGGVSWMTKIPTSWGVRRVKTLFEIRKRIVGEEGPDVLSVTQQGIRIKDIASNDGQLAMDYSKYQIVEPGDFVMNQMDLLTGWIDIAATFGVTSPDYRVFAARTPHLIHDAYFLYAFQNAYKQKIFYALGQGASHFGRWRLPREGFYDFLLPFPPKEEQVAIANFLNHETTKVDDLVDCYTTLLRQLGDRERSLITRTVCRGLNGSARTRTTGIPWVGDVPEHWELLHLRRVVRKFVDYRGRTPEKVPDGVPLVTATNIKNGRIDLSLGQEFMPEADYDEWMVRGLPERGDLLVTTEAPLGEVAQIEDTRVALAQRIILLKVKKEKISNEYLKYFFRSAAGQGELWTRASGSTALGIKASRFKGITVIVPPVSEQCAIVEHLDRETSRLGQLKATVEDSLPKLAEYRSSLISAAVTGQIDVRNYRPQEAAALCQ